MRKIIFIWAALWAAQTYSTSQCQWRHVQHHRMVMVVMVVVAVTETSSRFRNNCYLFLGLHCSYLSTGKSDRIGLIYLWHTQRCFCLSIQSSLQLEIQKVSEQKSQTRANDMNFPNTCTLSSDFPLGIKKTPGSLFRKWMVWVPWPGHYCL